MKGEIKSLLEKNLAILSSDKAIVEDIYNSGHGYAGSFSHWCERLEAADNADLARRLLYYVLQPMHDAIMSNNIEYGYRDRVLAVYDEATEIGIKYLASFYLGEPNVELLKTITKLVAPIASGFTSYFTKKRNTDNNGIYVSSINKFSRKFIEKFLAEEHKADTIVGCACGSFEVAMSLAGLTNTNFETIRYSKRRNDNGVSVIPEHEARLEAAIRDKYVIVIEDYVDSGYSLEVSMKKILSYKPAKLIGASVESGSNDYYRTMNQIVNEHKFKLYESTANN